MNNYILSIIFDSAGNLYATGNFTTAGGVSARKIAMWDGSSWSALGSGLSSNSAVGRDLAIDSSDNLYMTGNFGANGGGGTLGGISANSIGKWDGSSWSTMGSGLNSAGRHCMFDSSGTLWVAGNFTTAGGVSTNNRVATWNGSSWSGVGSGTANGDCLEMVFDSSGNAYVSGIFTIMGSTTVNYVAKWDGSSWSALSTGMGSNPGCPALAIDKNDIIYAGGYWTTLGDSSTANYTSKWDGTPWSSWINMNDSVEFITVVEK